MYGFPGSGKTTFGRRLSESMHVAHVQADRIRAELFAKPRYDKAENQVVDHLVEYIMQEFLKAGVSVVYDADITRSAQRRQLREIAQKSHAQYVLAWFQIDIESSFSRLVKRDRRTTDNKYSRDFNRTEFDRHAALMQHPNPDENFLVLSGKHSFAMQKGSLMKRLFELNMVKAESVSSNISKPGMVNLVPRSGMDIGRRDITIR